jgi:hypothetical protein
VGRPSSISGTLCESGVLCLVITSSENGGGRTRGVRSLIFQGENPMLDLNLLYLAMVLLKALF